MSDPFIDAVIYILFTVSVGFSGIGVIGLLLFPDIRSRLYTAVRATLIGTAAMVVSVICLRIFRLPVWRRRPVHFAGNP